MIPQYQVQGYAIHLLFLTLPDAETAIACVAARVAQGGHSMPEDVIRRRLAAGLRNFHAVYKLLGTTGCCMTTQVSRLSRSPQEKTLSAQTTAHSPEFQAIIVQVETALAQAAEDARELAERTGTPLIVREVRNGPEQKTDNNAPGSSLRFFSRDKRSTRIK